MSQKKLTGIEWQKIHTRRIHKRERTHRERLRRYKLGHSPQYRRHLTLPKVFDFTNNYTETANFLREIHNVVFNEYRSLSIDFVQCEVISPECCVVLAAEIDRCLRLKSGSVTGNYPTNEAVYLTLKALGFFNLLKIRADRPVFGVEVSPDAEIVSLVSGIGKKEGITKGIVELFSALPAFKEMGELLNYNIFRALTEAMGNTLEHAYPVDYIKRPDCVQRWWRAGFRHGTTVTMVLYDQGIGIPNTLPATWPEALKSLLGGRLKPDDGEMIKLAMEIGRTSANQQGRGKGLPDIKKLIDYLGEGLLKIQSYQGTYIYRPSIGETSSNDIIPLHGTLIMWNATAQKAKYE